MYKVFINPGHCPGIDPGAVNNTLGINEADIVKTTGHLVAGYLNIAGCEVRVLQSDNLYYDGVGQCVVETANAWGADLFVSIHCNAFDGSVSGTETCIYGLNAVNSAKLGQCIQNQIVNSLNTTDRGLKERPGLVVLKDTNMPAVLVETAFIDNAHDADLLTNNTDDFARAIARGVTDYLSNQI